WWVGRSGPGGTIARGQYGPARLQSGAPPARWPGRRPATAPAPAAARAPAHASSVGALGPEAGFAARRSARRWPAAALPRLAPATGGSRVARARPEARFVAFDLAHLHVATDQVLDLAQGEHVLASD